MTKMGRFVFGYLGERCSSASFGSNILIMDCMSLALTHSHGRTAASVSLVQSNFAPCYMHISDEIWLPNSCFCLFYWVLNNHVRQCFGSTPQEMACNHLNMCLNSCFVALWQ